MCDRRLWPLVFTGMRGFVTGIALLLSAAANGAPAAAPVPEQIAKAKSVFISNAGAEGAGDVYSGGDDRPYNQFYAAMKSWGRFELTPAPAGSDLVFELFTNLSFNAVPGTRLRLSILDPSTHTVLWTLNGNVKPGVRRATLDKNFDDAMASLVASVKELAARPVAGH
jgi:hypothetical protein